MKFFKERSLFLRNQHGMTLIQTTITLLVSTIAMGLIADILGETYGVSKDLDGQALIDTRHTDVLHRVGTLRFLRNHFHLDENSMDLLGTCLKGRGNGCSALNSEKNTPLNDPQGDFNSFYGLKSGKCRTASVDCVVQQKTEYRWTCPSDNECTELQVSIQTFYVGTKIRKIFESREHSLFVPARSLGDGIGMHY